MQPANAKDPEFLCCCCGDCCQVLIAAKRYPNPAEFVHSNFYAQIDPENCAACGVCVNVCTSEAITLMKKEKETIPPKDKDDLYNKMILERYCLFGALKIMGKSALGKKI
jgi:ferredoxin